MPPDLSTGRTLRCMNILHVLPIHESLYIILHDCMYIIEGAGQDYLSLAGSTEVTFTAGGSNISRCVTFTILDDTVLEGEHEFIVNITDVGSAAVIGDPSVCTVTIVDDEGESREEH